jgi:hypothetical protein
VAEQSGVKKRSRAAAFKTDAPGEHEAAALHWLRTGEKAASDDVITAGEEQVRQLLRLDAAGVSNCGVCSGCISGIECIKVATRQALWEGKSGAQWAHEARNLIGRRFEVCYQTKHDPVSHVTCQWRYNSLHC